MKWFLGIVGAVVFIILLIVLVFRRPNPPVSPANQPVNTTVSTNIKTNLFAQTDFTIEGKLVGEEERRSIRFTIARDQRRLEILRGYENIAISSTDLTNNETAFQTFLAALEQAGYSSMKESKIKSERGVCPLGRRYIFRIVESGEEKQRTWSTSCNTTTGTFAGNRGVIEQLFKAQIPDYNKLVTGVKL